MQSSFLSKISSLNSKQQYEQKQRDVNELKNTFHFWQGNQKFLSDGKIILGPEQDTKYMVIFLIFLGIVGLTFYIFILPYSTIEDKTFYGLLYGIFLVLFLIFYFLTVITEPGFLPHQNLLTCPEVIKASTIESQRIIKKVSNNNNFEFSKNIDEDQVSEQSSEQNLPINSSGDTFSHFTTDYCVYCKITKPSRTYHCLRCNACVRVFDHHSFIVNNCIGKRNYIYFIISIFFGMICTMLFIFGALSIYETLVIKGSVFVAIFMWIILSHSMLILMYCFFQLSLIVIGQTTKEFMDDIEVKKNSEGIDLFRRSETLIKFSMRLKEDKLRKLKRLI